MKWKDLATVQEAIDRHGISDHAVSAIHNYERFLRLTGEKRRADELWYIGVALAGRVYSEKRRPKEVVVWT